MISERSTKIETKRRASRQVVSSNHFCSVAFISFRFTINDFFSPPPAFLFLLSWSFFEAMRPNSSSTPVSDRDFSSMNFPFSARRRRMFPISIHKQPSLRFVLCSFVFFPFFSFSDFFFFLLLRQRPCRTNIYFKIYIYILDNYYNIFQNPIFICILIGSFKSNSHIFDNAD